MFPPSMIERRERNVDFDEERRDAKDGLLQLGLPTFPRAGISRAVLCTTFDCPGSSLTSQLMGRRNKAAATRVFTPHCD